MSVTDPFLERLLMAEAIHNQASEQFRANLEPYLYDPVAFTHDFIEWGENESLAPYQEEVLADLVVHGRLAVRSLHGVGKTTTAAMVILWFSLTRDAAGIPWKNPTTAGAWNQLRRYLWPEVHKWAKKLRWDKLGRDPFTKGELLKEALQLRHGQAFAVASDQPSLIEGAHADSLLFLFDESKAIAPGTFDAAEGAFAGASGTEAFALATSTPGEPAGRFYDIHARKPGLEDWHTKHDTLEQAIAAGRVTRSWADQRKRQWGADSAMYANRVLGEFHASDAESALPLSWLELAVERWKDNQGRELLPMDRLGVDVAAEGSDKTVLAPRHGHRVDSLRYHQGQTIPETAREVGWFYERNGELTVVIDTDGMGIGVVQSVRELGYEPVAFHTNAATELRDRSGELGFANLKAATIWKLREQLDPQYNPTIELPPDEEMLSDLSAMHWGRKTKSGQDVIFIEEKSETKARLGRSPDAGDAVWLSFVPAQQRRKRRLRVYTRDRVVIGPDGRPVTGPAPESISK